LDRVTNALQGLGAPVVRQELRDCGNSASRVECVGQHCSEWKWATVDSKNGCQPAYECNGIAQGTGLHPKGGTENKDTR